MSDNSQPVSSRRALREKRRAEMEALLANSKAEQAAKEQADKKAKAESAKTDFKSSSAPAKPVPPASKPADSKPAPAKATESKPAAKPATAAKKPAANSGTPKAPAKPAEKTPAAESAPKPQPAKTAASKPAAPKPAEAKSAPVKSAPVKSAPNKPAQAKPEESETAASKAPASTPAAQKPEALGERASLRRARDREALRERRRLQEEVGSLTSHVPTVEPADDPKPLTRRQLRLQALADQNKGAAAAKPVQAAKPAKQPGAEGAPDTTVMSVEDALAARRAHDPKTPVEPILLGEDDSEIDLEVLAHQREMAARAAIISRRAAERERLRVENSKQGKEEVASDPFTGAMGNIREVEERIAKTGISGPKTESVSLSLDAQGKIASKPPVKPAAKPAPMPAAKAPAKPAPKPAAAKPAAKPEQKPAAKPAPKPAPSAKPTPVAKAPVAAKPAPASASENKVVELPRIEAVDAQGLQPLDVQTHGVRRANNMLIAMIVALGVGGAALVAGLIMLLTN